MTDSTPAAPSAASSAATLTVRQLLVDLRTPLASRWHRNNFLTQFFNALSMSFPVGEQFFIDAVRDGQALLPDDPRHERLRADIAQFIGQEATHRHIHAQYNAHLDAQGLENRWQERATRRLAFARRQGLNPRNFLAITCAYEHLTATLAHLILQHEDSLQGAEERMQTLWRWHASEEIEHRSVALDLYRAIGGSETRRRRWYFYTLLVMGLDAGAQTVLNLKRSGTLWRPATWWHGAAFLIGPRGLVWRSLPALLRYLRRDFQPLHDEGQPQGSGELASRWLAEHQGQWRAIR